MPTSSGRPRGARSGRRGRRRGRRMAAVDETSAGGVVINTDRTKVALIGRLDRRGRLLWSLPKGHIEEGETPEQTAVREVAEETGILGEIIRPLGTIDYWFVAERRRIHKTVHHFLMERARRRTVRRRRRGDRGRLGPLGRAGGAACLRRRAPAGAARARTAGGARVPRRQPTVPWRVPPRARPANGGPRRRAEPA